MQLKILSSLYGGLSLAKDGMVYFVKGAIPEETVEARIIEKKRDYVLADILQVLVPSSDRQSPPCPVFGICGGCHYQYIAYERQVAMKQEIICDCLRRMGRLESIPFDGAIAGSPFHYRHRAQFKANEGKLGFYRENSHDIVEFETCLLITEKLNRCYALLKDFGIPPRVTDITVTAGDSMIAHIKGTKIEDSFLHRLIDSNILHGVTTDDGRVWGKEYTEFEASGYRYTVSPRSFLQSNWEMNKALIGLIVQTLKNRPESPPLPSPKSARKRLLDVFGGAGNFSLPLSREFDEITVVEENPYSVRDGHRNASLNEIKNIAFADKMFDEFKTSAKFITIIIDPPRIGLSTKALKKILFLAPERLFYISCNPATLGRDAAKLKEFYHLDSVRLVDMFPQTYHCEIFCQFLLK